MPKPEYLTNAQLIDIGRRYGSDDVAKEAGGAASRWRRDVAGLAGLRARAEVA
jgi:hypothetical protein